jgi:hypothetical protein
MSLKKYVDGLYSVETNINLNTLKKSVSELYDIIKVHFQDNKDHNGQSTLDAELYSKYNLLMYPFPEIHQLYSEIQKNFKLCLVDSDSSQNENYFIQCWLNYFYKGQYIDWHGHTKVDMNCWHGFFCLDTEPNSYTSYKWPLDQARKDLIVDVPSKNGTLVFGKSNGDMHRSSEWINEDYPRITIAFDIVPSRFLYKFCVQDLPEPKYLNAMKSDPIYVNHWIPI